MVLASLLKVYLLIGSDEAYEVYQKIRDQEEYNCKDYDEIVCKKIRFGTLN